MKQKNNDLTKVIKIDNFKMSETQRRIEKYKTPSGKEPFSDWFEKLDWKSQAKVDAYIIRVAAGATKANIKPVSHGIFEITIHYGPGIRVYFANLGSRILLLLCGGDKSTQKRDIRTATEYWRNYCEKNKNL